MRTDELLICLDALDDTVKSQSALAATMRALLEAGDDDSIDDPPVFLQCDERWGGDRYSPKSALTFCEAGCLVCSAASLAAWAGYGVDPPTFARYIETRGAFDGGELGHPSAVTRAFPKLIWHGRGDEVFYSPRYQRHETSYVDWLMRPADVGMLATLLERQPVVVQLDYKPKTQPIDTHFVLAVEYIPDPDDGLNDDLTIMDPMSGTTSVLQYFNPDWWGSWMRDNDVSKVARTLTGMRIWEVARRSVWHGVTTDEQAAAAGLILWENDDGNAGRLDEDGLSAALTNIAEDMLAAIETEKVAADA